MTKPFTSARLTDALKAASTGLRTISSTSETAAPPVADPVDEAPLIDEEAIATMEAVGARSGRDVLAKVWKLFIGQGPDAAFKLETLATAGDPGSLAKQAHFLKSMAILAGAARLGLPARKSNRTAKPDE